MTDRNEIANEIAHMYDVSHTLVRTLRQCKLTTYVYDVKVTHIPTGRTFTTEYRHGEGCKYDWVDVVYCLTVDAGSYDCLGGKTDDDRLADFLTEYGYVAGNADDIVSGMRAYRGCQAASVFFESTLGEEGLQSLLETYDGY